MLKRIGRIIRRSLAVIMLIAWIGLIALWIRSYWRGDMLIAAYLRPAPSPVPPLAEHDGRTFVVVSDSGGLCFAMRHELRLYGAWINRPSYREQKVWLSRGYPQATSLVGSPVNRDPFTAASFIALRLLSPSFRPGGGNGPSGVWWDYLAETTPVNGISRQFIIHQIDLQNARDPGNEDHVKLVILPYWSLALGMSVLAFFAILSIRQWLQGRRYAREGFCVNCGYDLRATPERSPECGTIAATPSANVHNVL